MPVSKSYYDVQHLHNSYYKASNCACKSSLVNAVSCSLGSSKGKQTRKNISSKWNPVKILIKPIWFLSYLSPRKTSTKVDGKLPDSHLHGILGFLWKLHTKSSLKSLMRSHHLFPPGNCMTCSPSLLKKRVM